MRRVTSETYLRLLRVAEKAGAPVVHPYGGRWNISSDCRSPYVVSFAPGRSIVEGVLDLQVRCRDCPPCYRARGRFWAARASREWASAPKTWMTSHTFRPSDREWLYSALRGVDDPKERTRRLIAVSGRALTLFYKRLRASTNVAIRYMSVPELHKDGTPHWHCLIHGDLTWRQLAGQWRGGFSKMNLVSDAGGIRYVTKYLHKGRLARVRASRSYGLVTNSHPKGITTDGGVEELLSNLVGGNKSDLWIAQLIETFRSAGIEVDYA